MFTTPFAFLAAPAGGYDADAQAFFDRVTAAGGTLSTPEKNATNTLVLDLKGYSIWTDIKAAYPMVGSSAASCAQNLKSSSFTATFSSGWTFASTGVKGNGSSTFMNTGLIPSSELGLNSTHISMYSRTENVGSFLDMGSSPLLYLYFSFNSGGNTYHANNSAENNFGIPTITTSLGFFTSNRISSTEMSIWARTTEYTDSVSSAATSTTQPTIPIYLGAYNNGGSPGLPTNREYAFASIGLGLTDTQLVNYYTAVQAFQTTLGRQV